MPIREKQFPKEAFLVQRVGRTYLHLKKHGCIRDFPLGLRTDVSGEMRACYLNIVSFVLNTQYAYFVS